MLPPHPGTFPDTPRPLVGRDPEVQRLLEALSTTRVVALMGLAGAGKTALALALAEQAADRLNLARVFVGCRRGWAASALLAAVEERLSASTEASLPVEDRLVSVARRLDGWPAILVIDAIDLVDPADADRILRSLASHLSRGIVVTTSRRAMKTIAHGKVPIHAHTVEGLAPADAERLLDALGVGPDRMALAARTGGHPFLLHLVARWGRAPAGADLLGGVLAELDGPSLAALRVVAAPTQGLPHEGLDALVGPDWEPTIARLRDLFLVVEIAPNVLGVPPVVAEAVMTRLSPEDEVELHGRIAAFFERLFDRDRGPLPDVVQAAVVHWRGGGDPERAMAVLERAAPALEDKGLFRELVRLAESLGIGPSSRPSELAIAAARALRQLGRGREALKRLRAMEAASPPKALRIGLWTEIGQAFADLADFDGALPHFFRALAQARESDDRLAQARLNNKVATVLKDRGEFDRAIHLYGQAAEMALEIDADAEVALALHNMGKIHYLRGQLAPARAMAERACAIHERTGDRLGRALTRNVIANVQRDLGDLAGAKAIYEENLELYRSAGHRFGEAFCLSNVGDVHRELGHHAEAIDCYRRSRDLAREIGNRFGEAITTTRVAEVHRAAGDYPRALETAEEARRLWEGVPNTSGVAWSLIVRAEALRDRGEYADALAAFERAQALKEALKEWGAVATCLVGRSMILADTGRVADAAELVERASTLLAERGGPESAQSLASQGYIALRRGDLKSARQILENLVAHGDGVASTRERGRALGSLASVALEEGDTERAAALVEESLCLAQSQSDRRGRVIALSQLGSIRIAQGRLDDAAEAYRTAHDEATDLGDERARAQALLGLGEASLAQGALDEASQRLEAARECAGALGYARLELRSILGVAEGALRRGIVESALSLARDAHARAVRSQSVAEEAFASALLAMAGAPLPERDLGWARHALAGLGQLTLLHRLDRIGADLARG